MQQTANRYPDWKSPAEDGGLLVWPEPGELLRDALANHARLSRESNLRIQNIPLRELRRRVRQVAGHDAARPLIGCGHQTELYHPGVWAKDALLSAAASRIDGAALHLAVDSDAPKHLVLRWPGGSTPITDDSGLATAAWCGLLHPPSPAHLRSIMAELSDAARQWDFEPVLGRVLDSLRRRAAEPISLSSALTQAQHELDRELGLRHHALQASPMWASEEFLLFAHHIVARADRFAADYNAALHAYRQQQGIRTRTRPMPDLATADHAIELPFWLDDLAGGRRTRPSVVRSDGSFVLQLPNGESFTFDAGLDGWEAAARLARFLASTAHRLAPRALTLTMFLRLCLVDQFVHGIGGGRYDQVTDGLIARHLGIEPPRFSVTTATLYFPGAVGRQRVCVPCIVQEGHRLRHALLGERKRQLVAQIEALPRRSAQRQALFYAMHRELDTTATSHPSLRRWRQELEQAQRQERQEQSLFDRELFYAIQPRDRLLRLIERYDHALRV